MKQLPYIAAAALILIGTSPRTIAQDNNPTGITGVFNGNSNTAGSYDPYTANATRTVVDLTVAGAVGEYPLQWSRTMNSRAISSYNTSWFGGGGGWRHSYSWQIDQSGSLNRTDTQPSSYNVRYPDGRVVLFDSLQNGTYRGPAGVGDRFQSFDVNATTRYVYLLLSDGGKVEFQAKAIEEPGYSECGECTVNCGGCLVPSTWSYTYTVKRIIDPFGGVTTLAADSAGRLATISEPAGRWLKIIYDPTVTSRISKVQAGYGSGAGTLTQTVTYSYGTFNTSKVLLGASYSDGTSAAYTYQAANDGAGGPLILTCNDVRYPGRMKRIKYEFAQPGFHGQLRKEMHPDGTAVATLAMSGNSRTETRGDLQSRTFTYGVATQAGLAVPKPYLLSSVTDFSGNKTYFGYDGTTGYLTGVKDPRGNTTRFTRAPYTGRITSVTPPPDGNGPPVATQYFYTDPNTGYYLNNVKDALGHTTQFLRDSKNRRYTTLYPDGGTEEIVYDLNGYNQVHTFKNRSGGVETTSTTRAASFAITRPRPPRATRVRLLTKRNTSGT